MRTLLISLFTMACMADYVVVWNSDGTELKSFKNPTQEQLDRLDNAKRPYKVYANEATARAATQLEVNTIVATKADEERIEARIEAKKRQMAIDALVALDDADKSKLEALK